MSDLFNDDDDIRVFLTQLLSHRTRECAIQHTIDARPDLIEDAKNVARKRLREDKTFIKESTQQQAKQHAVLAEQYVDDHKEGETKRLMALIGYPTNAVGWNVLAIRRAILEMQKMNKKGACEYVQRLFDKSILDKTIWYLEQDKGGEFRAMAIEEYNLLLIDEGEKDRVALQKRKFSEFCKEKVAELKKQMESTVESIIETDPEIMKKAKLFVHASGQVKLNK